MVVGGVAQGRRHARLLRIGEDHASVGRLHLTHRGREIVVAAHEHRDVAGAVQRQAHEVQHDQGVDILLLLTGTKLEVFAETGLVTAGFSNRRENRRLRVWPAGAQLSPSGVYANRRLDRGAVGRLTGVLVASDGEGTVIPVAPDQQVVDQIDHAAVAVGAITELT